MSLKSFACSSEVSVLKQVLRIYAATIRTIIKLSSVWQSANLSNDNTIIELVIDSSTIFLFFSFDLKCFSKASLVIDERNSNLSQTEFIRVIVKEWENPKNSEWSRSSFSISTDKCRSYHSEWSMFSMQIQYIRLNGLAMLNYTAFIYLSIYLSLYF